MIDETMIPQIPSFEGQQSVFISQQQPHISSSMQSVMIVTVHSEVRTNLMIMKLLLHSLSLSRLDITGSI